MDSFGITRYTNGGSLSVGMSQPFGSLLQSFTLLIHGGRIAEAEARLRTAMLQSQTQERKMILESLTKVAMDTDDPGMRERMFLTIAHMGSAWQL